ncbi:MAG TPA: ABC transporter ATP-binding protein [Candidatus Limnocylindrales bacterium]|nr:ABC transporter ATP-binding protein [Candidatus Limnocylindrales bacterium]
MDALATTGLTKRYAHHELPPQRLARRLSGTPASDVLALEDLTIEVHEGEIFGFLGPNGAGKSTTIRLLLGFLHPTSGGGHVLGLDIVRDSVAIRGRVGYLPGGIALYDSLSGERLLDYLGDLTGRPPIRRAELLDRLELSRRTLQRPVRDYSRGMRQKIGIIQALQHDPELAILDEPTEGLDPLMQRAFYGILDDLRAAGRTIFFSSHVLSEVERVCDRVAIVRRGRLVALQDVASLLEHRKRNVELRLADGAEPPRLEDVPGVSGVGRTADGRITCQLEGDVGPFLAAIAGHRIADLTIEPAHLEEAFLELYEDAEPDDDAVELAAAVG